MISLIVIIYDCPCHSYIYYIQKYIKMIITYEFLSIPFNGYALRGSGGTFVAI